MLSDRLREWKLSSLKVKPVTFTIYLKANFFVSVIWEIGFGIIFPGQDLDQFLSHLDPEILKSYLCTYIPTKKKVTG